jgi:hypothetical protein
MLVRVEILEAKSKCESTCKKGKNLRTGANEEFEKILVEWLILV